MLQTVASNNPVQQIEKFLDKRIILGRIATIDEELGTLEVDYSSSEGYKSFNIPHPHFSADSWIRAMPEVGSYVLIGYSMNSQYPEIIKVIDPSERVRLALNHILEIKPEPDLNNAKEMAPVDRIYRASAGRPDGRPFRKLRQGEIEIMGKGKSALWISRRGHILEKGNVVRRLIDSDRSTIQDWAVGHEKLGMDAYLKNCLWDSEYFGVVRRPSKDDSDLPLNNLLNIPAIANEIKGYITIEDRITGKVAELKSLMKTQLEQYTTQIGELKQKSVDWLKRLGSSPTKTVATTGEGKPAPETPADATKAGDPPGPVSVDSKEFPKVCQESVSYFSNVITTLDQLTLTIGELRTLGASVGYENPNFNIAMASLEDQRKILQTNGAAVKVIAEPVLEEVPREDIRTQFKTVVALQSITVPEYSPEAKITESFAKYKQMAATVEGHISEAINESKIVAPSDIHVTKKWVYTEPKLKKNEFCKEWRVTLSWKDYPRKIYEHVVGHVFDQDGAEEKTPITGKLSRARHTWWCDPPNEVKSGAEWLDTDGNLVKFLAECASKGFVFVIPDGHHYLDVGRTAELRTGSDAIAKIAGNVKIVVAKDVIVDANNVQWKVRDTFQVDATKIILNQEVNSPSPVTRPIQRTQDATYLDSSVINQVDMTTTKIKISENVKRRIVNGNVLLTSRQQEIEDIFTNIGLKQSSINMSGGNIITWAEQNIIEESKINVTKTQMDIVEDAGGSSVVTSKHGVIGTGFPTAGKVAW